MIGCVEVGDWLSTTGRRGVLEGDRERAGGRLVVRWWVEGSREGEI